MFWSLDTERAHTAGGEGLGNGRKCSSVAKLFQLAETQIANHAIVLIPEYLTISGGRSIALICYHSVQEGADG